ncbi:MAG: 3-oxoacyl-ACP reductase FabG [Deltaproteobacteria bacterium]|jgi:3-oxoacyl-[acyl-carrier protein] reductase|nr:3-oxoacyl-ACP reductase FabG [Deltaproteobacteria bacterium]MBW2490729.1 3-oxoacyl-ACP reductase FabG [Deltaproteobacteria bacterium]
MDKRIALVTGASRGIGAAIARALAQDGFDLWLNYKSNHEAAEKVKNEIEQINAQCRLLPFDVSDAEATFSVLDPLIEKETPYILVNNAGVTKDMLMIWMNQDDWKDVLSVTLDGFFQVTRTLIKGMLTKRSGRIINIVSTSGQSGMAGQVNYSTAKAGLIGATKALAAEVAKRNVLVNAVSPGFIETEMIKDIPKEKVIPMIPMQRFGTPEEVAAVVRFLCSDQASYITGQVIAVNGGVYM